MASRGLTGFGLMVILAVAGLGASPVAQADRDEESYQYGVSLAQGRAIASMSTGDNVEELCRGWLGMMFQYTDEELNFDDAMQGCTDALPDPPTILNPQGVYPTSINALNVLICNDLGVNGVSVGSVENIYHVLYGEPYRFTGPEAGRAVRRAVQDLCTSHIRALDVAAEQAAPATAPPAKAGPIGRSVKCGASDTSCVPFTCNYDVLCDGAGNVIAGPPLGTGSVQLGNGQTCAGNGCTRP